MSRALSLAARGRGAVSPNPMVGAVIVKEGRILGEGYHMAYGGPHAEVNAVRDAEAKGEALRDATVYVTLEPCSHFGKTPPCADLLAEKQVGRVVVATLDPNPQVAGRGIGKLRAAGIRVDVGCMEQESRQLNEVFLKYIVTKRPFVLWKCAMTLDGKTATAAGQSQWISSEASRREVHALRGEYRGIMAGIGTVLADDPRLTCRTGGKNPVRIIVDSRLQIPESARVLGNDAETIVAAVAGADPGKQARLRARGVEILETPPDPKTGRVDLPFLMKALGARGIDGILLEGGPTLAFSALGAGLIDKARIYIAPMLFGGASAKTALEGAGFAEIADAVSLDRLTVSRCGADIVVEGYPRKTQGAG